MAFSLAVCACGLDRRPDRHGVVPVDVADHLPAIGLEASRGVIAEPGLPMSVEVETPEEYMGNVMGDLSSRRGIVQGMEDQIGGIKVIKAEVPLSEMFGYSTSVRSLSQGRATYSMEFKHYVEAPKNVAEAVINKK